MYVTIQQGIVQHRACVNQHIHHTTQVRVITWTSYKKPANRTMSSRDIADNAHFIAQQLISTYAENSDHIPRVLTSLATPSSGHAAPDTYRHSYHISIVGQLTSGGTILTPSASISGYMLKLITANKQTVATSR